jgi:hypothetical protein
MDIRIDNVDALRQWLSGSSSGETVIYFHGPDLAAERLKSDRLELDRVARYALELCDEGRIDLCQRRNGAGFLYTIQRRHDPKPRRSPKPPLSKSDVDPTPTGPKSRLRSSWPENPV